MKIKLFPIGLLVIAAFVMGACGPQVEEPHPTSAPAHWTYEGEEGPEH